ncbi:ATP-binding protein [Cohnella rhizosphaerae]|uniref:ATP-binding protein n=1 Tax=Cohnella rhizosphaerae TaxID=1457232 RepID=A0A9X4KS78_9BACL|nr:ATP-binding protein [Cohnella rhizosphaerae]MDG0809955.1 ATP-binding protein [Cohnella rhizosphaerae]
MENAVKHSRKAGNDEPVRIEAAMEAGVVRVTVSDRGAGMTPEQVARIVAEAHAEPDMLSSDGRHIGLRNVLARCRLSYGDAFRFEIRSAENEGTAITLLLPETRR